MDAFNLALTLCVSHVFTALRLARATIDYVTPVVAVASGYLAPLHEAFRVFFAEALTLYAPSAQQITGSLLRILQPFLPISLNPYFPTFAQTWPGCVGFDDEHDLESSICVPGAWPTDPATKEMVVAKSPVGEETTSIGADGVKLVPLICTTFFVLIGCLAPLVIISRKRQQSVDRKKLERAPEPRPHGVRHTLNERAVALLELPFANSWSTQFIDYDSILPALVFLFRDTTEAVDPSGSLFEIQAGDPPALITLGGETARYCQPFSGSCCSATTASEANNVVGNICLSAVGKATNVIDVSASCKNHFVSESSTVDTSLSNVSAAGDVSIVPPSNASSVALVSTDPVSASAPVSPSPSGDEESGTSSRSSSLNDGSASFSIAEPSLATPTKNFANATSVHAPEESSLMPPIQAPANLDSINADIQPVGTGTEGDAEGVSYSSVTSIGTIVSGLTCDDDYDSAESSDIYEAPESFCEDIETGAPCGPLYHAYYGYAPHRLMCSLLDLVDKIPPTILEDPLEGAMDAKESFTLTHGVHHHAVSILATGTGIETYWGDKYTNTSTPVAVAVGDIETGAIQGPNDEHERDSGSQGRRGQNGSSKASSRRGLWGARFLSSGSLSKLKRAFTKSRIFKRGRSEASGCAKANHSPKVNITPQASSALYGALPVHSHTDWETLLARRSAESANCFVTPSSWLRQAYVGICTLP